MSDTTTGGRRAPSRRTVVKGAAWAVPAVAAVAAAPAMANSKCISVSFTGQSCKCPGSGNNWSYWLGICFKNICTGVSAPVTIDVTNLTNNAGKTLVGTYPTGLVLEPGKEVCSDTLGYTSESSASKIKVYYSVNGTAQGYLEVDAPPDCTAQSKPCPAA